MRNKTQLGLGVAAALAAALVLTACGGGGGGNAAIPPVADTSGQVPDSIGASAAAFLAFIQGLALNDETSEPLTFSAGFTPPPEDNTTEL